MEQMMREYTLINEHDPNVTIPIDAIDANEALYEALKILGWRLALPE